MLCYFLFVGCSVTVCWMQCLAFVTLLGAVFCRVTFCLLDAVCLVSFFVCWVQCLVVSLFAWGSLVVSLFQFCLLGAVSCVMFCLLGAVSCHVTFCLLGAKSCHFLFVGYSVTPVSRPVLAL